MLTAHRAELAARTGLAVAALGAVAERPANTAATHLWLGMSELEAERAAARMLRAGVQVTPPEAPQTPGSRTHGLRVCLGGPPNRAVFDEGLRRLTGALADASEAGLGDGVMDQAAVHEQRQDDWLISDDLARFDVAKAHSWISRESYWGEGIPLDTFQRSLANSLVVGAYGPDGAMAAMGRVVTDRATFGWICDVFVDKTQRSAGLSKRLMAYLLAHPDLQGFRRLHLATQDAHGLYEQFGSGR